MESFWFGLLFVALPLAAHAAGPILCDVQTGATADVKINNATALLPPTGGTIDCRGLTGAQTIQAYSLQPITSPTSMTGAPNLSGNIGNLAAASVVDNCSSSASPAVCSGAAGGSVAIAAGATTVVVDTTAVTSVSQIEVEFDETLGTKLGVTCNTSAASEGAAYLVSARTAGTSFTIKTSSAPVTHPACLSYTVTN